jgi:DNA-binding MarR family transcriptional regulator
VPRGVFVLPDTPLSLSAFVLPIKTRWWRLIQSPLGVLRFVHPMKCSERYSLIARLEYAISSMHYANRTVSNAYGTGLGLAESAILFELSARPELSPTELANRLCLTQVAVSRALKKLEEAQLAERHRSGRNVRVEVSHRGHETAEEALVRARDIFSAAYERLSVRDRPWFAKQFERMLEALGAPDAVTLPNDPPLMQPIRRLFRSLGFQAGYSYRFMELSSLEWHILRAVVLHSHAQSPLLASGIASDLGVSPRSIFPVVRRMEGNGWVARLTGSRDERERPLILAPKGKAIFARATEAALALLDLGTSLLSNSELARFTKSFELYTNTVPHESRHAITLHHEILRVRDSMMQQRVRAFIMQERVAIDALSNLPSQIVAPSHDTYVLVSHGALVAAVEIHEGVALHIVDAPSLNSRVLSDFIMHVVSKVSNLQRAKLRHSGVKVPRAACTPRCWAMIAKGREAAEVAVLEGCAAR